MVLRFAPSSKSASVSPRASMQERSRDVWRVLHGTQHDRVSAERLRYLARLRAVTSGEIILPAQDRDVPKSGGLEQRHILRRARRAHDTLGPELWLRATRRRGHGLHDDVG